MPGHTEESLGLNLYQINYLKQMIDDDKDSPHYWMKWRDKKVWVNDDFSKRYGWLLSKRNTSDKFIVEMSDSLSVVSFYCSAYNDDGLRPEE